MVGPLSRAYSCTRPMTVSTSSASFGRPGAPGRGARRRWARPRARGRLPDDVGGDERAQRARRDDGVVIAAGQFPAQRPVDRRRRRVQHRHRVAAAGDRLQQRGHQLAAHALAAVFGGDHDGRDAGHGHGPPVPPLAHVVVPGGGDQLVTVEGGEEAALVDGRVEQRLPAGARQGRLGRAWTWGRTPAAIGRTAPRGRRRERPRGSRSGISVALPQKATLRPARARGHPGRRGAGPRLSPASP